MKKEMKKVTVLGDDMDYIRPYLEDTTEDKKEKDEEWIPEDDLDYLYERYGSEYLEF